MSDTAGTSLWQVGVDAPLDFPLTYCAPDDMDIRPGLAVTVPLGRRQAQGIVLQAHAGEIPKTLKNISSINTELPQIPAEYLRWAEWLSNYYLFPIGMVLSNFLPPLSRYSKRASRKGALVTGNENFKTHALNEAQQRAYEEVRNGQDFCVHLLHGVTGSGKTEVYMQIIEDLVAKNLSSLVLVPEIALTPQLIQRFANRFGNDVAVMHSHLTPREQTNQWWHVWENEKKILVGARSALFCPSRQRRLIVVDEEHESSFKQDESLRYHARDAAIMQAKFCNFPVVLGSATPSLESWRNSKLKRYHLISLPQRVENRQLPAVEIVDMKAEKEANSLLDASALGPRWLSLRLEEELRATFQRSEQAALFLNRRGHAQSVFCPDCGYVEECPNCSVSLTLHGQNQLICHYCDYQKRMAARCTSCKEGSVIPLGLGTELLEKDLSRLFPSIRIARMDRDEIQNREDLEDTIQRIENREVDLLIGTQMIAKGLDFPGLTLVGIVLADIALHLPDFRAAERGFQLLTQVSGRAGRHLSDRAGKVVIQTFNPSHPAIQFAIDGNFAGFAEQELVNREELQYPPFSRLGLIRIVGPTLAMVEKSADRLRQRALDLRKRNEKYRAIEVLGPAPAPFIKLRGKFRHQLLVKSPDANSLSAFVRQLTHAPDWLEAKVDLQWDIDCYNLL